MSGCSSRQRREFLLDGLVEGVRGRNRTRRLNRRKGRHVASESSLSGRIIPAQQRGERWLLASLFATETRRTEWTSLPSTKGSYCNAAYQQGRRRRHGDVEWLHGGLSPPERHECPQNAPIPASCGSTTAP